MLLAEFVSLRDVGLREPRAFQISLQVILQTEEDGIREHSSSRLQVRINPGRLRWILLPVREFVAIGLEQEVHGLSLDGPPVLESESRCMVVNRSPHNHALDYAPANPLAGPDDFRGCHRYLNPVSKTLGQFADIFLLSDLHDLWHLF